MYFLSLYSVPGIILSTWLIAVNKADKISALRKCVYNKQFQTVIHAVKKIIHGNMIDSDGDGEGGSLKR